MQGIPQVRPLSFWKTDKRLDHCHIYSLYCIKTNTLLPKITILAFCFSDRKNKIVVAKEITRYMCHNGDAVMATEATGSACLTSAVLLQFSGDHFHDAGDGAVPSSSIHTALTQVTLEGCEGIL